MSDVKSLNHSKWECKHHVSTVGRDEEAIHKYINEQKQEGRRIDQA